MKKEMKKGSNVGKVIAVGAGVAALSAAAYVLFGPKGKENRNKISGWAIKMKGEIIEKLEEAKEITEPIYNKIVDEVSTRYASSGISKDQVHAVVGELRKHWKSMMKDAKAKGGKKAGAVKKKVAAVKKKTR